MQNDHDDKYEPHEESEYHFSDEEVTYEAEPQAAKPAAGATKESVLKQFTQRRLIISGIVFLVLVFAVYKMIAPSSTTPNTDIITAPTIPVVAQNTTPVVTQPAATPAMPANAISQATQPAAVQQPVMQQQPAVAPVMQQPTQTVVQTTTTQQPQPVMQQPAMQQPAAGPATVTTTYTQGPAVATMPGVIPVETTITTPGTSGLPAANDQHLAAQANQLSAQVQNNFEQKFNEFNSLTQALQGQVTQLNARVGNMETQLNQIVQVLTQQHANGATSSTTNFNAPLSPNVEEQTTTTVVQQQSAPVMEPVRIAYNVQAIIPGRAWLKSENGETLTVAEGDLLKNVGRVVKIDPYDGVVEINTGNRIVSLSYGNAS